MLHRRSSYYPFYQPLITSETLNSIWTLRWVYKIFLLTLAVTLSSLLMILANSFGGLTHHCRPKALEEAIFATLCASSLPSLGVQIFRENHGVPHGMSFNS
ncbi:hypothetical protein AAHE18_02G175200 [Arachis hypogaea]|nr:uncharacterized protein DS421_2g59020 [Arachis hypogaea]